MYNQRIGSNHRRVFQEDMTLFLWNFGGTNKSIGKLKLNFTLEQATKAPRGVEV